MTLSDLIYRIIYTLKQEKISVGKTLVQKFIYLLLNENGKKNYFIPYHYGPYSSFVSSSLSELVRKNQIFYDYDFKEYRLSNKNNNKLNDEIEQKIQKLLKFYQNDLSSDLQSISNLTKFLVLDLDSSNFESKEQKIKNLGWDENKLKNNKEKYFELKEKYRLLFEK